MKLRLFYIITIGLFIGSVSCNPIKEGVYFELNGYRCTSATATYLVTQYYSIPAYTLHMEGPGYSFDLITNNIHKGYTYFNQLGTDNNYLVSVTVYIYAGYIGEVGAYTARRDGGGYNNALEIIQFNDQFFEAKFNVRLESSYQKKSINITNGYIKMPI